MTLLELPRGYGKTTKLIAHSVSTGIPILVRTTEIREQYKHLAEVMRYTDQFPEPVTWADCIQRRQAPTCPYINEVLIDDLDTFLPEFLLANLHVTCNYATISTENVVYS